jgi:Rrf2 family iron-sulfur cluster assembly transcriptional regulator
MLLRREKGLMAVAVMLDIAFHGGRNATVSAADIAERLGLARRGMEPLLQALSRAGLLESVRWPRGGYRLGRSARDIRLDEILSASAEVGELDEVAASGDLTRAVVLPLWAELEAALAARLAAVSLDELLRRARAAGLHPPASEPIAFVI